MKKKLRNQSKKIIRLCIFSSGLLLANNAWSEILPRDTIRKAGDDSLKEATVPTVPNLRSQNVPVLFGEQPRRRLVQATGYLNGQKLESAPVTLLSNAFAGQLAGLYAQQTSGAPRFDNPALSLRGRNPLIVIDGVPNYNLISLSATNLITSGVTNQSLYDVLGLNPEQIESVTLLKDALSAAMLGNQGMDGVLMITTRKRGIEKNATVTFTAQAGVQTPIGMRKPLSAFDYASLYNEALINGGGMAVYSPAQLNAYKNGTDQYLYPNVNWQNAVLKKNAPVQRYNLSSGGNYTSMRYFLSLDYQAQGGLLNEDPATSYGTNVDYKRYIFRSNIDVDLDKRLSASFNLLGNIQDYYQPGVGYANVFNGLLNTPNSATPIYNSTGSFAGTRQYPTNPYAQAVATGYLKNNLQAASANISVKRTMDDLVKGLFVKALIAYSPSYEQQIDRSKNYNAFNYPISGDTTQHLRVNTITDQKNASATIERFQQTYAELSTGIDRNWNKHELTGLLLGRYDNTQGDNTLNMVNKGIAGRVNYSYDKRFNLEAAAAYNGNNRFAPGKQYDFYPSVGASWNVNNEAFLKNTSFLNELKLRASYGKVGNANPGYYAYQQTYSNGTAYFFGTGATSTASVFQSDLVNPNRVTEKANKLNIGLDLTYSHNRGWFNFDYYHNRQYDLLQIQGNNTAVLGQNYPLENIGQNKYYGIELNTGWNDKIGKFSYSISGNFSTVASRIIFNDEPAMAYPYLAQTGNPINQIRGYVADGFFNPGNLNAATIPGFSPSAGDVKYKDLNGDGVINQNDQTVIGNNRPLLFYGAGFSLQYAGLDMSVLVQGVANRDILTMGNYEFPFTNDGLGQAFQYNLNRYTPQTAATATMPRVTLGNAGADLNNNAQSSLYVRNGNYIRLKNFELGFSFGSKYLSAAKIKKVRLFVRGENLLTYSKYKESDPEDYTGLYPLQRIINGGLSVKL